MFGGGLNLQAAARRFGVIEAVVDDGIDAEDDVAALQQVALPQRPIDAADTHAIEKSAVGAAQIAGDPPLFGEFNFGVAAADGSVVQDHLEDVRTTDA